MIIIQIRGQQSFEMSLVEDNDVIQQFLAKAADYAFNIGVSPSRSRRGDDLVNAKLANLR